MAKQVIALRRTAGKPEIAADSILDALAVAVVVVDGSGVIVQVNTAGEQFLQGGADYLKGRPLMELLPADNPIFS